MQASEKGHRQTSSAQRHIAYDAGGSRAGATRSARSTTQEEQNSKGASRVPFKCALNLTCTNQCPLPAHRRDGGIGLATLYRGANRLVTLVNGQWPLLTVLRREALCKQYGISTQAAVPFDGKKRTRSVRVRAPFAMSGGPVPRGSRLMLSQSLAATSC